MSDSERAGTEDTRPPASTRSTAPGAEGGGRVELRHSPKRWRTADLLIAAAFGAMGALVVLIVSPVTTSLAATFPPAYAVAAGIHSVLPYLAHRLLGLPFAATLVGFLVGVLSFASTPLGPLILVSLLAATLPFDVVLSAFRRFSSKAGMRQEITGALAAATVLFLVSLPLFSAERLTAWMVAAVIGGRIVGQCGAAVLAAFVAGRVIRAGIRRRPDPD